MWMEQLPGVICDKRVPPHVKGKLHKMIVKPAILYGMETVPVTSSHVKKLEVTEMKICHTLRDHVRNDDIRERLKVENRTERCKKPRLRWFGHVKRRDQEYVGRKTGDGTFGTTWKKKKRKTETEMDGLCQPRHESYRNDER